MQFESETLLCAQCTW